ncbi:polyhydroxyalkanoate synthesis repressor PhaR [Afifella pfennigii]|uniref:polyhydroxyalkanoate synthesis repressor PhaR n=1 Tax=Afifella pfennigii TaxID=209897 RepID=UPI0004793335|nr:polyhydroxyalkanoate synthesis repressor PhaR [Afifella pfennigii]
MSKAQPTVIKKYANRRLYHTGTSTYVTLEDLARMVKDGEEFAVVDAKSGEDITRAVLGQIIFEQENKGQHLLPITFLRQLIRYYGDSMQAFVPSYLETSLAAFSKDQEKLREQMTRAFKGDAFGVMEEQARRNMEMFTEAMKMFTPFGAPDGGAGSRPASKSPEAQAREIEALRTQLREMQRTIDTIAGDSKE